MKNKSKIIFIAFFFLSTLLQSNAQILISNESIIGFKECFDTSFIKHNKIKSIAITFSYKKELQPMKDEYFKKDYFDFDSNGCNTKIISNSTSGISKITWKKHKNNVLFKILESEKNTLKTKTYFYENKKKYIQIIGVSKNENNNLFNTEVKNYENIETTYFIYDTSKNKTYTKTFLSSKKIPFQKNSYFYKGKKLLKSKTEHKYFSYKNDSTFYQYNSFNNLLEKITFFPADYDTPFYININYDNNKIISINKFELNSKKLIETQEFLYSKKTDYLHAIITKNTLTKELFIKKYNYTLY